MPALLFRLALPTSMLFAFVGGHLCAQAVPDGPTPQKTVATLQGRIIDTNGAPVGDAFVTLVNSKGGNEQVIHSALDGTFQFSDLSPATIRLTVTASGMETFVSPEMRLSAGEAGHMDQIILPIAPANTVVSVVATQEQVADAQLNAELHQRALGVIPNFYSSYVWDAAPLNFRQKTKLAFRSTTDPAEFVLVGATAGVEQARDTFKNYGQGAQGYGKRYGAAYADVVVSRFFGAAVFPSIFRQDPRYFYRGSGSVAKRAGYAMSTAFIQKGNSGHFQPAYSRILGSVAAGAISNIYRPKGSRGVDLIFRNVGIGIGSHIVTSLIREFVLRKVTSGIPAYKQGKPVADATAK